MRMKQCTCCNTSGNIVTLTQLCKINTLLCDSCLSFIPDKVLDLMEKRQYNAASVEISTWVRDYQFGHLTNYRP